ncbi:MAG: efflux RND transporter periplasmic adaptor subunit [Ignavibacteriae bacterium]|nr:efflux RND transporter periplasmic adaptor subunit [Ignavibacteriota bacterium]
MALSRKRIFLGLAIVVVLLIAAFPKLKPAFESADSTGSSGGVSRTPVTVHIVKPETLDDKILTTGTLVANEEIELRSELSGKIVKIHFAEGGRVQKGDLLVKINDAEMQAQLQREISRKDLAVKAEERQRQLIERSLISQEAYDAAKNELNSVNASIQLIGAQIAKTEIYAPFDGTIGLKYVSEGSYIAPTTRIATLQDTSPMKIDFSIPEKYSTQLKKNMPITFRVQGLSQTFNGTVYAIEPKIDQATRTILLRAMSPNPDGSLFPGAFAEVELIIQRIEEAITIPSEALIPDISGQRVFLFKNGQAESQQVETGIRTSTTVQVTKGITPGDTVITTGILQVRSGSPVQISVIQ